MGAGVNTQNSAVEPFGDEMKANKNPAYVHKRQYDKAFEKFKLLE